MKKTGLISLICSLIAVAVVSIAVILVLFFSGVSRFSFFPAALGALTVGAILMVQAHGQKPIEIDFTEKGFLRAKSIYDRHKILTDFLIKIGVSLYSVGIGKICRSRFTPAFSCTAV